MTADPRYLETMWDTASSCFLSIQNTAGSGESRIPNIQERAIAWCITSVAQAIALSPDDDPRIASYQDWMGYLFSVWAGDQYHDLPCNDVYGMSYAGMNTFGYTFSYDGGCGPDTAYDDCKISSFMQDFWLIALSNARDLQAFPDTTAAADLAAYEAHLAGARVKTLGGSGASEYCYGDAATYTMDMCDGMSFDPRDWDSTAGEVYENNYGSPNGTCGDTLNTSTVSGGLPAPTATEGQWAQVITAISGACDHGVSGACMAWNRIYTSSNLSDQTGAGYEDDATMFGIWPRGYTP